MLVQERMTTHTKVTIQLVVHWLGVSHVGLFRWGLIRRPIQFFLQTSLQSIPSFGWVVSNTSDVPAGKHSQLCHEWKGQF